MSRATESEHTLQRAAGSGAEHAPDLDAEHEPEAARRSSLAGLRRMAAELYAAPKPGAAPSGGAMQPGGKASGTSAEQQAKQHEKAERSSCSAVEAALRLATARIKGHLHSINTMIDSKDSEAGAEPKLAAMLAMFAHVDSELRRLNGELSTQNEIEARSLGREVIRLGAAVRQFSTFWRGRVRNYARRHGNTTEFEQKNPYFLTQTIDEIYERAEVDPNQIDSDWQPPPIEEIQDQAMQRAVNAVLECGSSVRMGVTAGKDKFPRQDLDRMLWHLREIHSMLANDTSGKLRHQFASQLGTALQTASAIQREISSHPDIALKIQTDLSSLIAQIRAAARGR